MIESISQDLMLLLGMLLATVTASIGIYAGLYLAGKHSYLNLWGCAGIFLAARVVMFMANPSMPLNDANVQFMSSERILWNLATITIALILICLKYLIGLLMNWKAQKSRFKL